MLQTSRLRSRLALSGSVAAILSVAGPALAQQQAPDRSVTVIEELVVTAQKREEALQDVPIAVSAFTQESLEAQGIEGGPDLQQSIPNVSFSRGNFTGYNFQIRGVGSKLVAGSGDTGVGVHLNNAPLTANRLFEAEFYDVERVEVLRGPQGTLYGRNATGGVVNVITAKPTDQFEADVRAEYGNFDTVRLRGAVNVPLGEMFALRVAGSYLNRDGFGDNLVTGNAVDDRNLYGVRATLGFNTGGEGARAFLYYEHFEEDDKRARVGKQLCRKDTGPASVGGVAVTNPVVRGFLSQGCLPSPIDSPESLGTLNSIATLGGGLGVLSGLISGDAYAGKTQNPDLRAIESAFDPVYQASADVYQLNVEIDVTDGLTLTALTSYAQDELFTFQDYNRATPVSGFNATPLSPGGVFADPQVGTSNQFRTFDQSSSSSDQFTQELRLSSAFDGPFNFNVGGIYLNFDGNAEYYVFSNTLTAYAQAIGAYVDRSGVPPAGDGRNYYRSTGPYSLEAKAAFGEIYYEPFEDFKITAGLRYTDDQKTVQQYPILLLVPQNSAAGIPAQGFGAVGPSAPSVQSVQFQETTGRIGFDWQPDLSFTDDTLLYAFYSKGYKAGGLNPPQSVGLIGVAPAFAPEFVNAYEVGTKNTLLDGRLQLNLTGFYYDYQGYQISRIVNRTSVNDNLDATIKGAEIEFIWEPVNNLRFNGNIGVLDTELQNGSIIDVFNRTQGRSDLTLLKGSDFSNCVAPTAQVARLVGLIQSGLIPTLGPSALLGACPSATDPDGAFNGAGNPLAGLPAILGGPLSVTPSEGVPVNLEGNELPNSPKTTLSIGVQYTFEMGDSWTVVPRADYYWQDEMFSRIYNTAADVIPAYDNLNLNVQLINDDMGLTIEAFVRNATDEEAITDAYLTDDSSGLFRNIFLTEPRTYGVAISKSF